MPAMAAGNGNFGQNFLVATCLRPSGMDAPAGMSLFSNPQCGRKEGNERISCSASRHALRAA
jgi:hypothetical protein